MIPDQYDHGHPIQGVDEPPTEPAASPSPAGRTPEPGYGPTPTAQGVRGYRDLTAEEVATINQLKLLQEQVARAWASVAMGDGVDPRKAAIARTHFEEGFSALVGSIARPHDPYTAALQELKNMAQQSQDHRPDEGSRA